LYSALLCAALALSFTAASAGTAPLHDADPWRSRDAGDDQVRLYFFWTTGCPHCQAARPFISELEQRHPWLQVESLPLDDNRSNVQLYLTLAETLNENAYSVPAFLFCGQMITGFDTAARSGTGLEAALLDCRSALQSDNPPWLRAAPEANAMPVTLPLLGDTDLRNWSLPLVTLVLAAVDSFNPCAFFVLLFLLSLLVNARSRLRMSVIGGLFVSVSGLVYFLFMTAWLNVFLLFGELVWITLAAGALALCFGALNLKDYFLPGRGPSLSVPESARPSLFGRMRQLINADNLSAMVTGTVVLAILANSYELLCTAGFPMVFTRLLTLNQLSSASYYAYLALYCLVYVIALMCIVGMFVWTLGRRKLSEREGRVLKLLSGLMMIGLGLVLIVDPLLLSNLLITSGVILSAVVLTWLISALSGRSL